MDNISVIAVRSKKDLKRFILFPWEIYKNNKCWVPPLIGDIKKQLNRNNSTLSSQISFEIFLALKDGEPAGRIFAGFDRNLIDKKGIKQGFFSMFECIDDLSVAKELFNAAFEWFRENGITTVIGPASTSGMDNDENKGLLLDCFDKPPVLMNSYNPPYYAGLIESCGFEKDYDVFAYYLTKDSLFEKNPEKVIEYAQKRYNFRVDTINLKNLEKEIYDLKHVMDLAIPDEWPDLVAPSLEDVREMAKRLVSFADPDLIAIARSGEEAIGFGIALPDYNQVLIKMNGRMNPLSIIKYLLYKRRITWLRFFVMFVVPEFRKKGVSYAIYYKVFKNSVKKGIYYGEGSTIGEDNARMRADIESFGGQKYKTYRIYKRNI